MSASVSISHILFNVVHYLRPDLTVTPDGFRSLFKPQKLSRFSLIVIIVIGLYPLASQAQSLSSLVADVDIDDEFRLNSHRSATNSVSNSGQAIVLPFGYSLFHRQGKIESNNAIQPGYKLRNGDVISVWIWGAFEYQQQHKIDSQGQIFLEQLGPVKVAGISVANLSGYLQTKLAKVYHQGVELYANLHQVAPIPLLVSGAVNSPGQYFGSSGDGILYYLSRAQGIDIRQGSYRRIQVQRSGKVVANIDLYPFLQQGSLPAISLQDFDVIFVQQPQVRVSIVLPGKIPMSYELLRKPYLGEELLALITLPKYMGQVKLVSETANGKVEQSYSLEEFKTLPLNDGDSVFFSENLKSDPLGNNLLPTEVSEQLSGGRHGSG